MNTTEFIENVYLCIKANVYQFCENSATDQVKYLAHRHTFICLWLWESRAIPRANEIEIVVVLHFQIASCLESSVIQ